MIRRPPRSTHCISSAASDVYKRQTQSTWGEHLSQYPLVSYIWVRYMMHGFGWQALLACSLGGAIKNFAQITTDCEKLIVLPHKDLRIVQQPNQCLRVTQKNKQSMITQIRNFKQITKHRLSLIHI
eukprot:TRINITY_DN37662_c0_g1_i2.p2 TRINITY_DN37662_c0_g1~~TRINITY_DN37662_c0_g1_i2.p2  ORF type:complete len:126 (-),score=18.20 TRINITY_DN37662_c0_g1_i2:181-558(-)